MKKLTTEDEITKLYYSIGEAAAELEVPRSTVRRYIAHYGIKLQSRGKRLVMKPDQLQILDDHFSKPRK